MKSALLVVMVMMGLVAAVSVVESASIAQESVQESSEQDLPDLDIDDSVALDDDDDDEDEDDVSVDEEEEEEEEEEDYDDEDLGGDHFERIKSNIQDRKNRRKDRRSKISQNVQERRTRRKDRRHKITQEVRDGISAMIQKFIDHVDAKIESIKNEFESNTPEENILWLIKIGLKCAKFALKLTKFIVKIAML